MLGRFASIVGVLSLLVAAPISAGTVYVALSSDAVVNGTPYETEIKVTNPAAEEKSFTAFFIRSDWDSLERPEAQELPVQRVPAGATRVYRGLNFGAPHGMLELTSSADLHFAARLVPKVDGGETVGINLPVVSSDNVFSGASIGARHRQCEQERQPLQRQVDRCRRRRPDQPDDVGDASPFSVLLAGRVGPGRHRQGE
jgi:hypothetical protein